MPETQQTSDKDLASLVALHDELVLKHSKTDDPQEEELLLQEIGLIEYAIFFGKFSG